MHSNKSDSKPKYRADIDGLRALAIIPVVIFHAFPSALQGGFIGVDIFFVISGFLISMIILKSLEARTFSLLDFYGHRIRRIFPALFTVLLTCLVFGWYVLLPDEFMMLGKHIAGGSGFVQNYILKEEAGYFDTAAELKPLLHLWSLAIEEQFYFFFPLLMIAAWRLGCVIQMILILLLISFCANLVDVQAIPLEAFYLPQTRAWELLAGSVLAWGVLFFPKLKNPLLVPFF